MRHIDVKKNLLKNGLRVISVTSDTDIFSIGVGVKSGSLFEDKQDSGISHLIEHMLFKGTKSRTNDELNDDIESLAGDLDIYTTYGDTVMSASIMKDRAKDCIGLIADMLMNANFPEKELGLEKKVIIEEIKMAKDDPEDLSYTNLYKEAFPETWYKYNIAGTTATVKGINSSKLKDTYRRFYTPDNTVVCIVSSYAHEDVVSMINESMGSWEGRLGSFCPYERPPVVSKKKVSHKKGITQTHVLYGFDIDKLNRREEVALGLLNRKIGSGPNTILFKELRDKKGYAYSVYSDIDFTRNIKMFYIYAGISEENLKGTLSTIDTVVEKLKSGELTIDEKTVRLIKNIYLTDTSIALESPSNIVDILLEGELNYSNPLEYRNVLSIMESVNSTDVKNVIGKVLKDPIIHILSPS